MLALLKEVFVEPDEPHDVFHHEDLGPDLDGDPEEVIDKPVVRILSVPGSHVGA